jgi:hypothetical protein
MISVQTADGELVKILHNVLNTEVGIHQLFGFTTKDKAIEREDIRKRQGFEFNSNRWKCKFQITKRQGDWEITNAENCEAIKEDNIWKLSTPVGEFTLSKMAMGSVSETYLEADHDYDNEVAWKKKYIRIAGAIIAAIMALITIMNISQEVKEEIKEEAKKPITVTVIKQPKAVNVQRVNPNIKVKPLTQKQKSHRAVQRNLGFLGLVGTKSVSKVTGGVPQKLKKATAGAGAGGDAGSGGELLVGLGKGLKKTTVGNTGVAGLGGVGTKGAGGGKGGYGNTMVASGEGVGISAIAVSSSDMVVDGGLSRYAINATIAKYLNQVRRCYEEQLKLNPGLEGLVTVNFEINGGGRLNFSNVKKSSLGNKKVEKCITTKMMGWQFPKPKGGVNVNVNYPFMLRPVGN